MVDAVLLQHRQVVEEDLPERGVNKWEALRELSAARSAYGLSDRDLAVLQALISFHPGEILGEDEQTLIVHPSNRAICERLNGMPCSTMRRHLARLVQAGVVVRRDSPNGKRYARRYGEEKIAFGFDLRPLVLRFHEFCEAAEQVRAGEARLKRLRETVSLMRRDLAGLAEYGGRIRPDLSIWDAFEDLAVLTGRALRRRLSEDDLQEMKARLLEALERARKILEGMETQNVSTKADQSEQHYQNSKPESHDSELRQEKAKPAAGGPKPKPRNGCDACSPSEAPKRAVDQREANNIAIEAEQQDNRPNLPLGLVLEACPAISDYAEGSVRHWHDLVRAADLVRPMMGISPSAWDEAKLEMGPEEAAVVLAAMLERFSEIRSHGGYLRHLTAKAAQGEFSCGPMVMALMRREAA
ncbi:replication initiation protein RepC [Jhaorihella thermophila]|uniref:Replication initiation protein RepC n=2 Tax=Jhaorihella thermophila TaxID=488547 RepID=A0A1H5YM21_9RHOB|nr:replication initiation protein RepC [Jhaorihella thermophila]